LISFGRRQAREIPKQYGKTQQTRGSLLAVFHNDENLIFWLKQIKNRPMRHLKSEKRTRR